MARPPVTVRAGDRVVVERCVVADRPLARMRGLLGRSDLPRGEGILLRPAASIHTALMKFTIDVVFVDKDNVVLAIEPGVRPWQIAKCKGAHAVFELRAGDVDRARLEVGDRLELEPVAESFADAA